MQLALLFYVALGIALYGIGIEIYLVPQGPRSAVLILRVLNAVAAIVLSMLFAFRLWRQRHLWPSPRTPHPRSDACNSSA